MMEKERLTKLDIGFEDVYSISTIGDGSCYFHAIFKAFHRGYQVADAAERKEIVKTFRQILAEKLPSMYDELSRGQLKSFASEVSDYRLEKMIEMLKSGEAVDYSIHELVSDIVGKDIYIINANNNKVFNLGSFSLYYKDRSSIVILHTGNHFELVAVLRRGEGMFQTVFEPDDVFITFLRSQMKKDQ